MIGRAFLKHRQLRSKTMKAKDMSWEDMDTYSSCSGCWPNILPIYQKQLNKEEAEKEYKRVRHPPVMPKAAMSSAFVAVKYDIDSAGKPINLRIIGGSHAKTFDAATFTSIKTWRAYERDSGDIVTNKKDWVTRMNFQLTNRKGEVLDFYGLPLKD